MLNILFLFFILYSHSAEVPTNLECSTSEILNLVQSTIFHYTIPSGLTESEIEIENDGTTTTEKMKGVYFKIEQEEAFSMYISTCNIRTNMNTEIYLFDSCESKKAKEVYKKSVSDETCSSTGQAATYVDLTDKPTYVFVRILDEENEGSLVISFVKVSVETNYYCHSAIEVTQIPFSDISNSTANYPTGNVECIGTYWPSRWYYLKGDGKLYLVDTCSSLTKVDTYLALVNDVEHNDSNDCKGAKCFKYNDNGCGKGSTGSTLLFKAEKDVDYHIGLFGKFGANDRFQINVQSVNETLPFQCENAQAISVPFTMTQEVMSVWPATLVYTDDDHYKTFYFSVVGTGNEMVFSTCPTASSYGTGVEVIESCSSNKPLEPKYQGTCGSDVYKVYDLKEGKTYIAKFYVKGDDLKLSMNVNLKSSNHYQCVDAMVLSESYADSVPVAQVKDSKHGCNGKSETHKGAWYQLHKLNNEASAHYAIGGTKLDGTSTNINVEQHSTCDSNQCILKSEGTNLDLFLNVGYTYIFVYPTTTIDAMNVGILKYDDVQHSVCKNPKVINVPFTSVGFIDVTQTNTLKCQLMQFPGFWYSISPRESKEVVVSTVSADTKTDTYLEVTTGCYPDENAKCIAYNDNKEGTSDMQSYLTFNAYAHDTYNIAVAQKSRIARSHRISMYYNGPSIGSQCLQANQLDKMVEQQTLYVHTSFAYKTKVAGNTLKGEYYRFHTDLDPLKITVRTCSVGTEINNLIGMFKSCTTGSDNGEIISTPDTLVVGTNSSNKACGNFGAQFTFVTEPTTTYFLFIAALENGYDGMIEAEVVITKATESDQQTSSSGADEEKSSESDEEESGLGGWDIFGIILYSYTFVVIVLVVLAIIFFKKQNLNSSVFSNF